MPTTIQINERTLELLRKLKRELNASSYDEAIVEITLQRARKESFAGILRKYKGRENLREILRGLRNKNDRF